MLTDAWCKPSLSFPEKPTNLCSYITKMIPHYVLAITEAAPWHQVESLRDALWKHLTYQMSVKVNIVSMNSIKECPAFHPQWLMPVERQVGKLPNISSGISPAIPFTTTNSTGAPVSRCGLRRHLDRFVILEAPRQVTRLCSLWSTHLLCHCRIRQLPVGRILLCHRRRGGLTGRRQRRNSHGSHIWGRGQL